MRKLVYVLVAVFVCISCQNKQGTNASGDQSEEAPKVIDYSNVKEKSFSELFTEIEPNQIKESPFDLFPKINGVVTAGDSTVFNSMVIGDGALGQMIGKYVTICGLRGSRYTLEILLKEHHYTMSFFDEQFRDQFILFGQSSGRDSDKMATTTLTPVSTPSGNMTYKEARLVIECDLAQTHTVSLDEVYSADNKKFYEDAYNEVGSYHKIVMGDITHVWVRK